MNVNFEYYKIFFYVAKYHNFTKAAHTAVSRKPQGFLETASQMLREQ